MKKIRLGILGVGNMGSSHSRNVLAGKCPEFELVAIADWNAERVAWYKKEISDKVACFATCEEMIDSGLIDACLIAIPHYDHPKYAMLCMQKGIHVLVEKPAGVYTMQVREMNEEADKHPELAFGMMFNQRTNCIYRKVHELVHGGAIGELKRVNWIITDWYRTQFYYDSGAWRATWNGEGGGVLLNQCPHQLDLLQWIVGLPCKVQAFCHEGKWHDIEVEDDVTAYLEYPNGATGVFITTTADAPGTNRLEITGTKGTVICQDGVVQLRKLEKDEREWCATCPEGFRAPDYETIVVETDGEFTAHPGVMNAFAANILRKEALVADGREGINGLMLSNAMHLASWLGQPVSLPVDEELFLKELNKRRATSRIKTGESVLSDTKGTY